PAPGLDLVLAQNRSDLTETPRFPYRQHRCHLPGGGGPRLRVQYTARHGYARQYTAPVERQQMCPGRDEALTWELKSPEARAERPLHSSCEEDLRPRRG